MKRALTVYLAGVAIGLWRTDGPPLTRVTLAMSWPLGVLSFAITTTILLLAAAMLFPAFGVVLAAGLAAGVWFFRA